MHHRPAESPPRAPAHRTAAVVAAVLAVCSALLLTLVATRWRPLLVVDGDISRRTHRSAVREQALTHAVRILTDWVWGPLTMRLVCAAATVWLMWRRADRWTAVWVAVTIALATIVQQSLKAAVARPRPIWPDPVDSARYAAFPSGHAMTATVVCGLLLWLLHRYGAGRALWGPAVAVAAVSVVGVGLTRVWLGVHWPSDVVGGWLFGALVVAVAVVVHECRRGRRPHPEPG
ncbi:phosphatase PAP2 family protein [Streptomyces sp. NPDC007905]|uniref:phosphatase PAP2 family protein n=1 Tax=Streptomyces sp. NPDC007905 TaxID=3364788 RepID=UPI0036EF0501